MNNIPNSLSLRLFKISLKFYKQYHKYDNFIIMDIINNKINREKILIQLKP